MRKIYSLYKGDEYLTSGTKQELANWLGVKIETITFYISPTYAKRGKGKKGNRKRIIYIGEEYGY